MRRKRIPGAIRDPKKLVKVESLQRTLRRRIYFDFLFKENIEELNEHGTMIRDGSAVYMGLYCLQVPGRLCMPD